MSESSLHLLATWAEIGFAVAAFVLLLFVAAPYGRHDRKGWGPVVPNAAGWVIMESPAVLLFGVIYTVGDHAFEVVPLVLGGTWMFHYIQRTFVFPLRLRTTGKHMPLVIVAMAFLFNVLNAYVIARWISHLGEYSLDWLRDPRFLIGGAIFILGFIVNQHADDILINLRKAGETGYRVPHGWLFDYVASPNYLGEIVEWIGFAIATWSLPGLAFALFTAANVIPRASSNLKWYRETFPGYPADRKALIPRVW
jgi:hypothetical protein